ncbi:MAG TPA: hypothetical protein VMZ91_11175, partial [Candidatus Paceibacterota bacterium]|nr:hypothetical protein [Candidatus Paceibacterota bacterium]
MVYKKYVYKRGKKHGPYYYHSYRHGAHVKKIYIGGKKEYENYLKKQEQERGINKADKSKSIEISRTTFSHTNIQKKWLIAIPIIVIVLIFAAFFIYNYSVTGRITLDTQDSYLDGENISGTLRLGLKNGELLPINSKLIISQDGIEREISLAELLETNSEGDFYVEDKEITGNGQGYGFLGEKITYPEVFFKLKVYDSSEEEPQDEETSAGGGASEETPIEAPAEEQVEQQPIEKTSGETAEKSIEEPVQKTETTK